MDTIREARLLKIFSKMNHEGLDAMLVSCPQNRFYLSGFYAEDIAINESSGMLFIKKGFLALLTDSRYTESASIEAPDFKVIQYSSENPVEKIISTLCLEHGIERLGIEAEFLSVSTYLALEEAFKKNGKSTVLVPAKGLIEKIRAVKEEDELLLIKDSLRLSEEVMEDVYEFVAPGTTEKEVAWFIEKRLRERGAEAIAFPPIVAVGPRASLPHAHPTDRKLEEGVPIIVDMGCKLNYYCSDITRTIFLGHIPEKWEQIYNIVAKAQTMAMETAKPGMTGEELDRVARSFIEESGYGAYFGHGLGHGVGLAVHELPGIRKKGDMKLMPGMVFTVEPGIYIPGEGGIRLENMVVVTEKGVELLNRLPVCPPTVIK